MLLFLKAIIVLLQVLKSTTKYFLELEFVVLI